MQSQRKTWVKGCHKAMCSGAQHVKIAQVSKEIQWNIDWLDLGSSAVSKGQSDVFLVAGSPGT